MPEAPPAVRLARLVLGGMAPGTVAAGAAGPDLAALARRHREALDRLARLASDGFDHGPAAGSEAARAEARIAFDRFCAVSPEASVAAYSLGDARLLAAATAELVGLLQRWGLARPGARVLDVGCGIGRLTAALADRGATVVGIDVSEVMIATARARHPGLRFEATSGRDLASFANDAFDLVLMVDVLPYVVRGGIDGAAVLVGEAARVLGPGGRLAIFNFSYRGDDDTDRADFERICAARALRPERRGTRDLATWDGAAWTAVRRPVSFAPPNLGGM